MQMGVHAEDRDMGTSVACCRAGFTLIELLVGLAVAAVLLVVAVPAYRAMIERNLVASQANSLLADLHFARSEAVTRGRDVTVCKSGDGQSCTADGGWQQGWIIFVDTTNSGVRDGADEPLLRVNNRARRGLAISGTGTLSERVTFDSNGFAEGTVGTLSVARPDDVDERTDITVLFSGNMRTEKCGPASPCKS